MKTILKRVLEFVCWRTWTGRSPAKAVNVERCSETLSFRWLNNTFRYLRCKLIKWTHDQKYCLTYTLGANWNTNEKIMSRNSEFPAPINHRLVCETPKLSELQLFILCICKLIYIHWHTSINILCSCYGFIYCLWRIKTWLDLVHRLNVFIVLQWECAFVCL